MKTKYLFFSITFVGIFLFSTLSDVRLVKGDQITANTVSECNTAGGICTPTGSGTICPDSNYTFIGWCDSSGSGTACCQRKGTDTLPGSEYACVNTLQGNCFSKSRGCNPDARNVGLCPKVAGEDRICCSTVSAPTSVSGPKYLNYELLEPLPIPGASKIGDLKSYLTNLYTFSFWAIGIAVVFMLTIGGFLYLTSAGNTSRLGTAKTIIFDSFLGLLLALFAWLFLYVINPDLVKLNLTGVSLGKPPVVVPSTTVGGPLSNAASQILSGVRGVRYLDTGDCRDSSGAVVSPKSNLAETAGLNAATACAPKCNSDPTIRCTKKTNLSETMLSAIIATGDKYDLTITSFAGGGHSGATSSHYTGRAVDLVPANRPDWQLVVDYLRKNQGAKRAFCDSGRPPAYIVPCTDPTATHVHAEW